MKCETWVACAMGLLASRAISQQGVNFTGLHADPLGDAALTVDSAGLQISNIGSSGQDGVRILHPAFSGLDLEFEQEVVAPGMRWEMRSIGSVQGVPGQLLAHVTLQEVASTVELRASVPIAANSPKRVEFLRDGRLLASSDGITADHVGTIVSTPGQVRMIKDLHVVIDKNDPLNPWDDEIIATTTWKPYWNPEPYWPYSQPALVQVPWLSQTYDVDELRVIVPVTGPIVLDHTDLMLNNTPDLTILAQGPIALDDWHVLGLSGAFLSDDSGALKVAGIGASGLDGVAVALPESESFLLELAGLPLASTLPVGAKLELSAEGALAGVERQQVMRMTMTKSSGPLVLDASAPGVSSFLLELFDDGVSVAATSMPPGDVLRFGPWPKDGGCNITIVGSPTGVVHWLNNVQVTIPGLGTFPADEARIAAASTSLPIAHLDIARVAGKLLGSMKLASVSSLASPAPTVYCTAKVNSLGCTPAIGFTGEASFTIDDFVVTATDILNLKSGILMTSMLPAATPFAGGYLCVKSPIRRSSILSSGGSSSGADCSGTFSFAYTAALAAYYGLRPGDTMNVQFWYRDAASAGGAGLTNALEVEWRP